ncbi:MAG: hypothetical protein PF692_13235 [Kiritimatiellae bacterium]|nr:hypothetical protein [Kiritimatiellia bacterium]
MSNLNKVDNTPDELDDIFDQKPGNRMVWIVPSILLHLAVLALWLLMPEKERVIEERKVVINKQQAEQLQRFVKDANLQELQVEVGLLQDIKQQMDQIRQQEIVTLKSFTKEMQTDLPEDIVFAVEGIKDIQQRILTAQKAALKSINLIQADYVEMSAALQASNYTNMSLVASRILDERKKQRAVQAPILKDLQLLQANIDSTDSTLSWVKHVEIQKDWGDFVDSQEAVLVQQVASIDKEVALSSAKTSALGTLRDNGLLHEKRVDDYNLSETNRVVNYWKTLNEWTSTTNRVAKDSAATQIKIDSFEEQKSAADKEMLVQKKIYNRKAKTPDETKENQLAKKKYDELKAKSVKLSNEIKVLERVIARNNNTLKDGKRILSKLKYPTPNRVPYAVGLVNAALERLDGFTEALGLQEQAIESQKIAIKEMSDFSAEINRYLEKQK